MLMNASSCATISCVDVYDPVKIRRLKAWAESDANFLRKLSMAKDPNQEINARLLTATSHESLDQSFVCRQRYLRSYTFETFGQGKDNEKQSRFSQIMKQYWLKIVKKKKKTLKGNSNQANKEIISAYSLWKDCLKFLFSCAAPVDVHNSEETVSITR